MLATKTVKSRLHYARVRRNRTHWKVSTGTVHASAKPRLTGVATGSPPEFNLFFIGPLPTFPENFMQIRSEFGRFCGNLITNKEERDKQTTTKT